MNKILNIASQDILDTRNEKQCAYTMAAFIVGILITVVLMTLSLGRWSSINQSVSIEATGPNIIEHSVFVDHELAKGIFTEIELEQINVPTPWVKKVAIIILEVRSIEV